MVWDFSHCHIYSLTIFKSHLQNFQFPNVYCLQISNGWISNPYCSPVFRSPLYAPKLNSSSTSEARNCTWPKKNYQIYKCPEKLVNAIHQTPSPLPLFHIVNRQHKSGMGKCVTYMSRTNPKA